MKRKRVTDWDRYAKTLGFGSMKGWLAYHYITKQMEPTRLALFLGVSERRFFQLLKKHGVKR
jgi:hypothetical protein